jgi:hypothetical protein
MDQRSIVLYLARKGLTAMEVYNNLVVTFGPDTKGDSSVMRFLREAKFPSSNPPTTVSEENSSLDDSNESIFLALTEQPFASVPLSQPPRSRAKSESLLVPLALTLLPLAATLGFETSILSEKPQNLESCPLKSPANSSAEPVSEQLSVLIHFLSLTSTLPKLHCSILQTCSAVDLSMRETQRAKLFLKTTSVTATD